MIQKDMSRKCPVPGRDQESSDDLSCADEPLAASPVGLCYPMERCALC